MNARRAANYSQREKQDLLETVGKYINIIENKQTDRVNLRQKAECWERIAAELAAKNNTDRTGKQVRVAYHNLKRQNRKLASEKNQKRYMESVLNLDNAVADEAAQQNEAMENLITEIQTAYGEMKAEANTEQKKEKAEIKKTGGGSTEAGTSSTSQQLLALLDAQAETVTNMYDSAWDYYGDSPSTSSILPSPARVPCMQPPISRSVPQKRRRSKSASSEECRKQYYKRKLDLVDFELQSKKDLHETEMKMKRELHELNLLKLNLEVANLKKTLQA